MNYYFNETREDYINQHNAIFKPRSDAGRILSEAGYKSIDVSISGALTSKFAKIFFSRIINKEWITAGKALKKGDIAFIQYPLLTTDLFFNGFLKKIKKRGVRVVALIHDIESIRQKEHTSIMKLKSLRRTEDAAFANFEKIIVHNDKMANELIRRGASSSQIIVLGLFDYLMDGHNKQDRLKQKIKRTEPIIFAGNLSEEKAGFIYKLPENYRINLFGTNYSHNVVESKKKWIGSFPPEELASSMTGSFGLVWDGTSIDGCRGGFGEYLRFNNPYKLSMYLACGVPVIIWKEAAMADFITENQCGFAVESLLDVYEQIEHISDAQYKKMIENAEKIGQGLRDGIYLLNALKSI